MAQIIHSHLDPEYKTVIENGAYYYSHELVNYIIPYIKTDRPWYTIRLGDKCEDRAIYFIHNNLNPERYEFVKNYKDVILVVSIPEMVQRLRKYSKKVIHLPLSINTSYVQQFKTIHDRKYCAAGRKAKLDLGELPRGLDVDILSGLPRKTLLQEMAHYEYIFAVGRTAIEAKALGCSIMPYDPRYPDPTIWKVVSNQEAIPILQSKLDAIDML